MSDFTPLATEQKLEGFDPAAFDSADLSSPSDLKTLRLKHEIGATSYDFNNPEIHIPEQERYKDLQDNIFRQQAEKLRNSVDVENWLEYVLPEPKNLEKAFKEYDFSILEKQAPYSAEQKEQIKQGIIPVLNKWKSILENGTPEVIKNDPLKTIEYFMDQFNTPWKQSLGSINPNFSINDFLHLQLESQFRVNMKTAEKEYEKQSTKEAEQKMQIDKENRHIKLSEGKELNKWEKKWENEPFSQASSIDNVIEVQKLRILEEANPEGDLKFLTEEANGVKEPFAEIIAFVNSGGKTKISPQAYRSMIALQNDPRHTKYKEKLGKKMDRYKKMKSTGEKKKSKRKLDTKIAQVFYDHQTYQLAMAQVANDAKEIMDQKGNPNKNHPNPNIKSSNNAHHAQFIMHHSENSDMDISKFVEQIQKDKNIKNGYSVRNEKTNNFNGDISDAERAGRITVGNILLDQGLRSMALLTMIANFMVGLNTGQWGAVMPYIAGGGLGMYALSQGVLNEGINKIKYPDQMAKNIMMSSFDNHNYNRFFADPLEVTLLQNLQIDKNDKRPFKTDITNHEKENKKPGGKKLQWADDNSYKPGEKVSRLFDGKVYKRLTKHVHADEFQDTEETDQNGKVRKKSGRFSKYLPEVIHGVNGQIYSKNEFLSLLAEKDNANGSNSANVRFDMLEKTASSLGDKDSFIPHLTALHQYARHQTIKKQAAAQTKNISQKLKKAKQQIAAQPNLGNFYDKA